VTSPEPLALWRRSHWELSGVRDAERFFGSVGSLGGTDLFLEGSSQPPAVQQLLAKHCVPGAYLAQRQTVWPASKQWRLPSRTDVLLQLADLARAYAAPELADHVFIYSGDAPLLEWPDAFTPESPILISGGVAEDVVSDLARSLTGTVRWNHGAVQQGVEADEAEHNGASLLNSSVGRT
jgi:hypothetical protein